MFVLKVYLVISSCCLVQNFVTRWTYGSAKGGGTSKRAPEHLLWEKFAILSGIRLVRLACLVYDVSTNPGEADGFF